MAEILTVLKKEYTLKTGDVLEVKMRWETLIPEDEEICGVIDPNDYDNKYEISYKYPEDAGYTDVDILEEAGCCSFVNIEDYIKDNIEQDIPDIADYEIFDVDDNYSPYQEAKVRVIALQETKV